MRSRVLPLGVATVAILTSPLLRADFPSLDARSFRPPTDETGSLYLEPPSTPGNNTFQAAVWASYAWRPGVVRDTGGNVVGTLVGHQVVSHLIANVGVSPRAAVGVDVPFALWQTGDRTPVTDSVSGGQALPAQALGDVGLVLKGDLVPEKPLGGFGLAALGRFAFPTGSTASYLGEGTPLTELRLLAEYRLVAFALQATAGFAFRGTERDVLKDTYGNELPWGVGLSVRPQAFGWDEKGHWTWTVEMHGPVYLPPSAQARDRGQHTATSPIVAGVSARYALGKDVSVVGGTQFGITQALGNAPVQFMASLQWAPHVHDADGDGIPDEVDECPELAEDKDGFEDSDGCPDPDNDDDGVPDSSDRCPTEKEDLDGFQDDDGCPDPDNDKDGVLDVDDACPNEPGPTTADANTRGCPDRDGDGIIDKLDKCPDVAENKNGVEDDDGCPEPDDGKSGTLPGQTDSSQGGPDPSQTTEAKPK